MKNNFEFSKKIFDFFFKNLKQDKMSHFKKIKQDKMSPLKNLKQDKMSRLI